MSDILYTVNPDRNVPWNDLPLLPVRDEHTGQLKFMKSWEKPKLTDEGVSVILGSKFRLT